MEITEGVDKVRSLTAKGIAKGKLAEGVSLVVAEAQLRGIEPSGISIHRDKDEWEVYLWGDTEST